MNRLRVVGFVCLLIGAGAALGAPMSGAIFTTESSCDGTNVNIFDAKDAVYLDGGPAHPGSAGLPDGLYYVQVTEPDGALLGATPTAAVSVSSGEFAQCYQLSAILLKASDATPGYDDTTNGGGEYKVWISADASFPNNASKTDNFKVKATTEAGHLVVNKFYDANANGVWNAGEPAITGWQVTIQDAPHVWLDFSGTTPVDYVDEPGYYAVTESAAVEQNWRATTAMNTPAAISEGNTTSVDFGNLCLGWGGGLTLGFWSNKNGEKLFGADDLALMTSLNLRDAYGSNFDPPNYKTFRTWILGATATNMANMLSAQLAAMELNVLNGNVSASSLIYAPGTASANPLGYATVGAVMAEADASLGLNGYVVGSGTTRTAQEAVKNALDRANNNLNFVQTSPCAFTFPAQ